MKSAWVLVAGLAIGSGASAADVPLMLKQVPWQKDVEYEVPPADKIDKCKGENDVRGGKIVGFVLLGPEGQVIRRFTDTDGNGRVDQWRYYQHGIEVYRDIDTNGDDKPDQCRWLNLGGSRWGIDRNGDKVIDEWKSLSAAEASREAILAVTTGDLVRLKTLMITAEDLKALGVTPAVATKLLEGQANLPARMRAAISESKVLTAKSKWTRFDAQMPCLVPADEGKARTDLQVFENAMAVVEPGPGLVQIGEMIRVGEVWKLTQVPAPLATEGTTKTVEGGVLMQPLIAGATDGGAGPSAEVTKLLDDLQALDKNQPTLDATRDKLVSYNRKRADLLAELYAAVNGQEEKEQFLKQYADQLAAGVQTETYPDGLSRLTQLEETLRKGAMPEVLPYVVYRRLTAQYAVDMKTAATEKRADIQKAFLDAIENFAEKYPSAEDAPEAMLQIATTEEFSGKTKEATAWYRRLAAIKTATPSAAKAQGAIRRLEMKDKPFVLSGTLLGGGPIHTQAYRGKSAVLVFYWATWCQPCKEDLPALRALYQQYHNKGFEIIGVCLDIPQGDKKQQAAALRQFLDANKVPWPQIFEEGGLDSAPAVQYGVFSLPAMFLIDEKGIVISNNSSIDELKKLLPQMFDKK